MRARARVCVIRKKEMGGGGKDALATRAAGCSCARERVFVLVSGGVQEYALLLSQDQFSIASRVSIFSWSWGVPEYALLVSRVRLRVRAEKGGAGGPSSYDHITPGLPHPAVRESSVLPSQRFELMIHLPYRCLSVRESLAVAEV